MLTPHAAWRKVYYIDKEITNMKRRTTYKIERIMDLGNGPEKFAILETNDKIEFFEMQDELMTVRGVDSLVKETTKTATFKY